MSSEHGVTRILQTGADDSAMELEKLRRNITVLFTDLKGSTAYFERYGDAAGLLLVHRCNTMLGQAVERHGGRVIKTIGDAVMAAFEAPAEAVAAAIEMQEAITRDNADKPASHRISVRIGINYGLGIVKSNDVFGDVVNVASRVESAAAPEQILISSALHSHIAGDARFALQPAGRYSLKGKSEELELYEVVWRTSTGSAGESRELPDFASMRYKLVQVRNDGKPAREFEIAKPAVIGRFQGEFTFPHDVLLQAQHARVLVEVGNVFVEPLSEAPVYFSLLGPYRLESGDVLKFGDQVFQFHLQRGLLEGLLRAGKPLGESKALQSPVAELVSQGTLRKRIPLLDSQVTFGRTKGTHTFPEDGAMSRAHARIYQRGEDFFLEDLGSTNGTFVMAREQMPVPAGACIALGGQLLRVEQQEATVAAQ